MQRISSLIGNVQVVKPNLVSSRGIISTLERSCRSSKPHRAFHSHPVRHQSQGLWSRIASHGNKVALVNPNGDTRTYPQLLSEAVATATSLRNCVSGQGRLDERSPRIAMLCPRDSSYIKTQWAIWQCGAIAVPLSADAPTAAMEYCVRDSQAAAFVVHNDYHELTKSLRGSLTDIPVMSVGTETSIPGDEHAGDVVPTEAKGAGTIIYTSGTTGPPKGVLHTAATLGAQADMLIDAWGWSRQDHTFCFLPLHHVHGLVNVVHSAMTVGASVEMFHKFDAAKVWQGLTRPPSDRWAPTIIHAVPTVYHKLIEHYRKQEKSEQDRLSQAIRASRIRVMICGSAALTPSVLEEFRRITGHTLLERYGMSEFGMALSNPLKGERVPGSVGSPLPGVRVRIVDENLEDVGEEQSGQLLVNGPNVFDHYWDKPEATEKAFTIQGKERWFLTGDVVERRNNVYWIKGRMSADIIKTAGFKVSALDIENVLAEHPDILEQVVVGLPDDLLGERVAVVLALRHSDRSVTLQNLRAWCADRLPKYQLPSAVCYVDSIPRNAMGKVNKKELVRDLKDDFELGKGSSS